MSSYGRKVLTPTAGTPVQITADGNPHWRAIGIAIDWAAVAAAGSDVTWNDGNVLKTGKKGLRYGQVLCKITASGKWGPYDPAASDGRQTLARGNCVLLNMSLLEEGGVPGLSNPNSDHPGVIEGGMVWKARLLATTGTASLAAGPTFATLEPVLPELRYTE